MIRLERDVIDDNCQSVDIYLGEYRIYGVWIQAPHIVYHKRYAASVASYLPNPNGKRYDYQMAVFHCSPEYLFEWLGKLGIGLSEVYEAITAAGWEVEKPVDYYKEPDVCPECGSDDIRTGQFESDEVAAWRTIVCECGYSWMENFAFDSWEELC